MYAVSTTSLEICKPLAPTFSAPVQEAIKRLTASTTELGAQLNRDRASVLTKVGNTENKNSDRVWKQMKRQLGLVADNPVNAEKSQAMNKNMYYIV